MLGLVTHFMCLGKCSLNLFSNLIEESAFSKLQVQNANIKLFMIVFISWPPVVGYIPKVKCKDMLYAFTI
jgi:hypothetical protein